MEYEWYYLNPDNRKKSPEGAHCERCKKPAKNGITEKMVDIVLHESNPWFRLREVGEQSSIHLGRECSNILVTQENKVKQ